ncbi:MAG: nickel pincer cofactor biosynthesis protein LarB [Phyllobacteriaceae bacterium]|nr:nickel pincer cofactor biosynthesis protein LarB [Phyllobacteriaceae bacterium]
MSDFVIDWERERRTGVGEAVLCEWKSAAQIESVVAGASSRLLLTRLAEEKHAALSLECRGALDFDPISRTAVLGGPGDGSPLVGAGVVCAGTSDLPVAREAARTLAFHGFAAPIVADVGVAGLWRLMQRIEEIRGLDVVIAVAGMEGALFSVLAGLVEAPIVAVPTSVGYGTSAGGAAALSSALSSCAPGVVTVNIDNGFGAACAAIKMLRRRR